VRAYSCHSPDIIDQIACHLPCRRTDVHVYAGSAIGEGRNVVKDIGCHVTGRVFEGGGREGGGQRGRLAVNWRTEAG
jgi:hypothetical protein